MFKVSLQNKLIACFVCIIIPLIVFAYYLIEENISFGKKKMIDSAAGTGEIVRSNVDMFIEDTIRLLMTIAQNPQVKNGNPRETMNRFIEVLNLDSNLVNLFAANQAGEVYTSLVWHGDDSLLISDRAEFKEVLDSGKPVLSKRTFSRATGQMILTIFVPILEDNGYVTGVIGAEISLKQLQNNLVNKTGSRQISNIAVTDVEGNVIIHSDYKQVYEETNVSNNSAFNLAKQGKQGIFSYKNEETGSYCWVAYSPTRTFPGSVLITVSDKAMQPPVKDTMKRWLQVLLLIIIFLVILSMGFARMIVKPIEKLIATTKVMAMGNLHQKIKIDSGDELEELSNAFNLMSERLSDQIEKLALATKQIEEKRERQRILLTHLVSAQEEERNRIAADIHDGVLQMIVGTLYEIRAVRNILPDKPARALAKMSLLENLLSDTIVEMRGVISDLRPPLLEDMGLLVALKHQIKRICLIYQIPINFNITGEPYRLEFSVEVMLFRIIQEMIQNAAKHSGASSIDLNIDFGELFFTTYLKDNGCGFDLSQLDFEKNGGMGLAILKERTHTIGAQVKIHSQKGEGTEILLTLPID
ncbi:MAG TPA: HAMP domain-containing protein [Gelria sp.]|jgi:signal transduction histidine kinase|nr:HAMP domain-containing protein [Gelria sp.]